MASSPTPTFLAPLLRGATAVFQAVRLGSLLLRWRSRRGKALLAARLKTELGNIRRASLIAWCGFCGLVALHYGGAGLDSATLSAYLIEAAVMIGGTAAIVFSITIALVQNVSDIYSSRHFTTYVNNWHEVTPFTLIVVITIVLFVVGLIVGAHKTLGLAEPYIIVASLSLIGTVFALIDAQFATVRRKLRPTEFINFLGRQGNTFVQRMRREAESTAQVLSTLHGRVAPESALATTYNRFFSPAITDLGNQIELLIDISMRLAERQELETAKLALTTSGEITAAYIEARQSSSVLLPSTVILVPESDSRSFFAAYFDQLNRAAVQFVRDDKDTLASHAVEVYRSLAEAASQVRYLSAIGENPILDQIMWSLYFLAKGEGGETNAEVVFQTARVLGEIATLAAANGLEQTAYACEENIAQLVAISYKFDTTSVALAATTAFASILVSVFKSEHVARNNLMTKAVQNIAEISTSIAVYKLAGRFVNDVWADTQGYIALQAALNDIFKTYGTITDDAQRRRYRGDVVDLLDVLFSQFRMESKRVPADSLLAGTIGRFIGVIGNVIIALLQDQEFKDAHKELRQLLRGLVYSPYWFLYESGPFRTNDGAVPGLADVVASIGLDALTTIHDRDVVKATIDSISAMADCALKKAGDANGYGDARILERACYVGIVALSVGWVDVVRHLKNKLDAFQEAYTQRYLPDGAAATGLTLEQQAASGPPFGNQVLRDLENFAKSFEHEKYNGISIRGDVRSALYQLVDESDVWKFIEVVWPDRTV